MRLPLTRLDFRNTNVRVHELTEKRAREGTHSVLRCAVDGATDVGLASGDRAEVDDMPGVARLEVWGCVQCSDRCEVRLALRTFNEQLGDGDQAHDVRGEHGVDVRVARIFNTYG